MQLLAQAKVNLALHVVGQRDDGYHLLDTLVTFAEIGDRLTIEKADQLELAITGPHAAGMETGEENLVIRAARLLQQEARAPRLGARLSLEKVLPIASGIGGGSADAAAALAGLNRFWDLRIPESRLQELALLLGADVPMCLMNQPALARGIGELIEPVGLASFPIVLVNPRIPIATPSVFEKLSEKSNSPLPPPPQDSDWANWVAYLSKQRNDLQTPARSLAPQIDDCLAALDDQITCRLARLSGSGATCFGLFETSHEAESAAASLQQNHPGWWVVSSQTIAAGSS